jgi:hypothetical protein
MDQRTIDLQPRPRDEAPEEPAEVARDTTNARSDPPVWLVRLALILAGAVLCMGSVGLLLADNDKYTAPLAFGLGALVLVGFIALILPALRSRHATRRSAHVVAAMGVCFVVAIGVWNSSNVSEHVLINRDPGAYVNTGRWIARHGTLQEQPKAGPFRGPNALHFPDIGMLAVKKTPLRLQFHAAHLLPVLLAEGYAVGGNGGLFGIMPWLGAIALLQFFVLAWRLFGHPVFALSALVALGIMLPEVSFSRDAYSEIPTQIFLFAALVLLVDRRLLPHPRVAFGAGLLLGAIQATRIDAGVLLIGLPPLFAIAWLHAPTDEERRRVRASSVALVAGLIPGCVLGFTDLLARSSRYWHANFDNERQLLLLCGASIVASVALVIVGPWLVRRVSKWRWNEISWVACWVVIAVALGAWFIRPEVQPMHHQLLNALQRGGRLVFPILTAKYETSMWWMSWYLGPITLLAAIVGAGFLVRELLRGRRLYALGPAFLLVPGTVLFLWYAEAYTDQVWVTRRYLTTAFPLIILLAIGLGALLWRTRAPLARVVAIVIAIGAVAFPLYTIFPVRSARDEGGYLNAVQDVCRTIGPNADIAVVLNLTAMTSADVREDYMPQTFRSFCGANVGTLYVGTAHTDLVALARKVAKYNKKLYLVASGRSAISMIAPEAKVIEDATVTNRRLLTQSFNHAPASYETQSFPIVVATLPKEDAQ